MCYGAARAGASLPEVGESCSFVTMGAEMEEGLCCIASEPCVIESSLKGNGPEFALEKAQQQALATGINKELQESTQINSNQNKLTEGKEPR